MMAERRHTRTDIVPAADRSSGKADKVSLTPEQIAGKRAFRETVRGVGGLEACVPYTRVGKSQLGRYCDETCLEFAPIDVIAHLEPLARNRPGWPHMLNWQARALGFATMALPSIEGSTIASAHLALAETHKDSSEVSAGLLEALAAGRISEEEAQRLAPAALETAEAFLRMHALLQRIAGGA